MASANTHWQCDTYSPVFGSFLYCMFVFLITNLGNEVTFSQGCPCLSFIERHWKKWIILFLFLKPFVAHHFNNSKCSILHKAGPQFSLVKMKSVSCCTAIMCSPPLTNALLHFSSDSWYFPSRSRKEKFEAFTFRKATVS